jgi:hypothetical protein
MWIEEVEENGKEEEIRKIEKKASLYYYGTERIIFFFTKVF